MGHARVVGSSWSMHHVQFNLGGMHESPSFYSTTFLALLFGVSSLADEISLPVALAATESIFLPAFLEVETVVAGTSGSPPAKYRTLRISAGTYIIGALYHIPESKEDHSTDNVHIHDRSPFRGGVGKGRRKRVVRYGGTVGQISYSRQGEAVSTYHMI